MLSGLCVGDEQLDLSESMPHVRGVHHPALVVDGHSDVLPGDDRIENEQERQQREARNDTESLDKGIHGLQPG